jgi:hypothetical protein
MTSVRLDCLKRTYDVVGPVISDDLEKSEILLRDSLEFMNSQYLLHKHYKNNTKQTDATYEVRCSFCRYHDLI